MQANSFHLQNILQYILLIFRIGIGITVIKVGYELASNTTSFGYYEGTGFGTGLFIIGIGCYFFFNSIYQHFFEG